MITTIGLLTLFSLGYTVAYCIGKHAGRVEGYKVGKESAINEMAAWFDSAQQKKGSTS